jgi:hypothetical protein
MGWFHGIYTTARMLFGRKEGRKEGRKGKEDSFFGSSCRCGFFITHGLLETGGLTRFLMRFDDERAKETMAGRSCLVFSFFVKFFFFSEDAS